jgi:hypothetical protein
MKGLIAPPKLCCIALRDTLMFGTDLLRSQSSTAFVQSDTVLVYFHQRLGQSELFECISNVNIIQARRHNGMLRLIQIGESYGFLLLCCG